MESDLGPPFDRAPAAALEPASFVDLLRRARPEAFPGSTPAGPAAPAPAAGLPAAAQGAGAADIPHGTTILALRYEGGVVIAGDRRATEGYSIAHRTIEKVFPTDDSSAVAIAGAAGPAIEMVHIFQTELEHYEKIEGERLTLEGRANKLSQFLRANLPMAMQGMVVVPLFVGYDEALGYGRIFKYDVTGGRYEESDYYATGSGGRDARGTIKKRYQPGMSRDEAVKVALEALFDASEEDVATGGPDVLRRIYPNIAAISADGVLEIDDDAIAALFNDLLAERGATVGVEGRETVPSASADSAPPNRTAEEGA
ncbi:MAG TPA: proteasome subunit beta [Actinomycetota bacterium]|nr:proteasome subunit beta [Actinomycetota bacterium]